MTRSTATVFAATLTLLALGTADPAMSSASRDFGTKGITKCGTIDESGSYALTRDLNANGDCIVIDADFVSLNLTEHVISGNGSGAGVTDAGTPRLSVKVTGGTITNFAVAIDLNNSAPVNATNLRIIANTGALDILQCSDSPLVVGQPSGIVTGSNSVVEGNLLRNNVGTAIKVGSGSIVASNTIRGTQDAVEGPEVSGICALSGSRVYGNAIVDNADLAIQANSGSSVSNNTARDNGRGIRANAGSSLTENTVHVNTGIGIEPVCPSNLVANAAVGNSGGNIVPIGGDCNLVNNLAP